MGMNAGIAGRGRHIWGLIMLLLDSPAVSVEFWHNRSSSNYGSVPRVHMGAIKTLKMLAINLFRARIILERKFSASECLKTL